MWHHTTGDCSRSHTCCVIRISAAQSSRGKVLASACFSVVLYTIFFSASSLQGHTQGFHASTAGICRRCSYLHVLSPMFMNVNVAKFWGTYERHMVAKSSLCAGSTPGSDTLQRWNCLRRRAMRSAMAGSVSSTGVSVRMSRKASRRPLSKVASSCMGQAMTVSQQFPHSDLFAALVVSLQHMTCSYTKDLPWWW